MRIFMWPWSLLTPVIIVAATVFFMTLLYTSRKDGFQAGQLASYHPLFMSLAFLLMTPLGALAFVADLGPLNRRFPDKGKRRTIHGIFSLMSLFFALMGYLVMYTSNKATGVDHFDFKDKHPSRSAHIVIGYLALLGMALQSLSGLHMFVVVTRDGVMRWKCHKVLGPICWLLGLAAMFLAVWFESKIEGNKWKISTVLIAWVAITAVLGITMSHICCSRRDHVAPSSEEMYENSLPYYLPQHLVSNSGMHSYVSHTRYERLLDSPINPYVIRKPQSQAPGRRIVF